MNGKVYGLNRARGTLAIETELYGFTVVELNCVCDLHIGDVIEWDSDLEMGAHRYRNVTTREDIEVTVVSHFVSRPSVRQFMGV